jgi:hypothetical protein
MTGKDAGPKAFRTRVLAGAILITASQGRRSGDFFCGGNAATSVAQFLMSYFKRSAMMLASPR